MRSIGEGRDGGGRTGGVTRASAGGDSSGRLQIDEDAVNFIVNSITDRR